MDARSIRVRRAEPTLPARAARAGGWEVGQVLAARVVSRGGGGEATLQIGREEVRVTSEKPLVVGDRLHVSVESRDGRLALHAVESQSGTSSSILRWLLARTGGNTQLADAIQALAEVAKGGRAEGAERVNALLRTILVDGPLSSSELAGKLASRGERFEATLLSLAEGSGEGRAAQVRSVVELLLARALGGSKNAGLAQATFGELVAHVLTEQLAQFAAQGDRDAGRFVLSLRTALLAALAGAEAGDATAVRWRELLLRSLHRDPAQLHFLKPRLSRLLVPQQHESPQAAAATLRENLKARLFLQLAQASLEGETDAIARVLESIEQEQVRQLLRSEHGDEREWNLVLKSEGQFRELRVRKRHSRIENGDHDSDRYSIMTEFSRLGSVRVDLELSEKRLSVRFLSPTPSTVALLQERLALLEPILSRDETSLTLSVLQSTEAAARGELEPNRTLASDSNLVDVSA